MIFKGDIQRYFELCNVQKKDITTIMVLIYFFHPRLMPIGLYRASSWLYQNQFKIFGKIISMLNFFLFGIEIAAQTEIKEGLFFPHTFGIVIGASHIGKNATIYQGVTLGAKTLDMTYNQNTRPKIGDNVTIGAGAKLLGNLTVGDNCVIGANAVATKDIPANSIAIGIPALVSPLKKQRGHS